MSHLLKVVTISVYSRGIEILEYFTIAWGIPRFIYRFGHHSLSNNNDYRLFASVPKGLYTTTEVVTDLKGPIWVPNVNIYRLQ